MSADIRGSITTVKLHLYHILLFAQYNKYMPYYRVIAFNVCREEYIVGAPDRETALADCERGNYVNRTEVESIYFKAESVEGEVGE